MLAVCIRCCERSGVCQVLWTVKVHVRCCERSGVVNGHGVGQAL